MSSSLAATKWFVGGKLNVAYNCVDRHVEAGRYGTVHSPGQ
jgi:acetyl-CoA synthetase